MSGHTKGPWTFDYITETVCDSEGNFIVYETNANEHDGALIAAAPDLLEALTGYDQAIRVAIKMLNRTGSPTAQEVGDELTVRLGIACDAIYKARGES